MKKLKKSSTSIQSVLEKSRLTQISKQEATKIKGGSGPEKEKATVKRNNIIEL